MNVLQNTIQGSILIVLVGEDGDAVEMSKSRPEECPAVCMRAVAMTTDYFACWTCTPLGTLDQSKPRGFWNA